MQISVSGKSIEILCDSAVPSEVPIILLMAGDENATGVWDAVRERTDHSFTLAVVPVADWNRELSPWQAERVFKIGDSFGGEADKTLDTLEKEIVPAIRATLNHSAAPCYLAGYSLAGLCAAYAPYRSAAFAGVVSASGSLWFPGFVEYAAVHAFIRQPEAGYFSVGDREKHMKNPVMCRVEDNMSAVCELFRARGVNCVFERNPGNHFQDVEIRLAKGIAWILGHHAQPGKSET